MHIDFSARGSLHALLMKLRESAASSQATFGDHASATTIRGGRVVGIGESHGRGIAAHADLNPDGTFAIGALGVPSTGEKGTLEACCSLVDVLNAGGVCWNAPELVERPHIDAIARAADGAATRELHLQVVRAPADAAYYHALRKSGAHQATVTPAQCADVLREAIALKVDKIPGTARGAITLVVNVRDAPVYAFPDVVDAFHATHGAWAAAQGFDSVWVAGLVTNLVTRLDVVVSPGP